MMRPITSGKPADTGRKPRSPKTLCGHALGTQGDAGRRAAPMPDTANACPDVRRKQEDAGRRRVAAVRCCALTVHLQRKPRTGRTRFWACELVGDVGFEPTTPSVSRKCSPPELIARACAEAQRGVLYRPAPKRASPARPRQPGRGGMARARLAPRWGVRYPTPCAFAHADVAQLVEHNLAKVGVAGSNPVVRSIDDPPRAGTGLALRTRTGFRS
jgi:hypothetical protein